MLFFHLYPNKFAQSSIYTLGKKLSNTDFVKMFDTIRSISNTEVGLSYLLSKNYEGAILQRGMDILREDVKEKPGHAFLVKLGDVWTNFYQNILPTLQLLFGSIPTYGMTVKQMTVVSFRDGVLFKLKIDEALSANDQAVPKSIKQMFCILLQVWRFMDWHSIYSSKIFGGAYFQLFTNWGLESFKISGRSTLLKIIVGPTCFLKEIYKLKFIF